MVIKSLMAVTDGTAVGIAAELDSLISDWFRYFQLEKQASGVRY